VAPPYIARGLEEKDCGFCAKPHCAKCIGGYVNVDVYRTPSPNFCLKYVYTFLVSHIWIVPASIRLYLNLEA